MPRARYAHNQDFYRALGRRIAKARLKKATQEQLAKSVKLSRTSIINIEKGRQQVLVHTLLEIARALDVPITQLIPKEDSVDALLLQTSGKGREWILNSVVNATTNS